MPIEPRAVQEQANDREFATIIAILGKFWMA